MENPTNYCAAHGPSPLIHAPSDNPSPQTPPCMFLNSLGVTAHALGSSAHTHSTPTPLYYPRWNLRVPGTLQRVLDPGHVSSFHWHIGQNIPRIYPGCDTKWFHGHIVPNNGNHKKSHNQLRIGTCTFGAYCIYLHRLANM
jgi:hypothetical protein